MQVAQKLPVDAVAAMLPRPQIAAVAPVDGRPEGAIDQADLASDQHGQLRWVAGVGHVGEEAHHLLVIGPGSCLLDADVFV